MLETALVTRQLKQGRRFLLAAVIAAVTLNAGGDSAAARGPLAGQFEYYALALSWSPTYCASEAGQGDPQQCGRGRRYAFVLHGLWPQWQRGWPEYCASRHPSWLAEPVLRQMLDIMPSRRLVIAQWKKHGSCSGLDQQSYFELSRNLYSKVEIPDRYRSPEQPISVTPSAMIGDFVAANPGLQPGMMSLSCGNRRDRGRLQELRICFDRGGAFTACGPNEARQCRAQDLFLPPVR
jgi:ribonuclease T2